MAVKRDGQLTRKKLFAVVHCLKMWRHYLGSHKAKVYTENMSLKYFETEAQMSAKCNENESPRVIALEKDPKFTSAFWKHFSREVGLKLRFRTAFHSQTNGKTERVNEVLKQYLRNLVRAHSPLEIKQTS